MDVPSTTCESKPVDACTSIELELCKDVSTLFMKIMVVWRRRMRMRMMNSMFAFMSLSGISINGRLNLRFLKNSVAWRKRRFVFIVIHMIISVIKVYQNALRDHTTPHSQVCEPAYEAAPAPKALYDAPY